MGQVGSIAIKKGISVPWRALFCLPYNSFECAKLFLVSLGHVFFEEIVCAHSEVFARKI